MKNFLPFLVHWCMKETGKTMLQHPCIIMALLSFIFDGNTKFITFFLANCDIYILLRYIRFSESFIKGEENVIVFKKGLFNVDYLPRMAERFALAYATTEDEDIINHINLKDEKFKQIFKRELGAQANSCHQLQSSWWIDNGHISFFSNFVILVWIKVSDVQKANVSCLGWYLFYKGVCFLKWDIF